MTRASPSATIHTSQTTTPPVQNAGMSGVPEGFSFVVLDNDEVRISHHGRPATVLRGAAGARFLSDVQARDPQELMARVTGNYKRGNERTGKNHPRNRAR